MDPMPTQQSTDNTANNAPQEPGSPIDSMIQQVDSYIKDPKLITPQTLMQLKSDLEDLKTVVEGDQSQEQEPSQGGLSNSIAQTMGGR